MAGSSSTRIGAYEVLFDLARGGTATVSLARQIGDAGFERLVAIKRFLPHLVDDPETFAMASDEARLAALIKHPNVVSVTEVIDKGGELCLVLEYVEGFSLAKLQSRALERKRALEPALVSRILQDAARGLHAAHEAKDLRGDRLDIVHRDVSPQNILVGSDGTTRLIDFGIAQAERRMTETRSGIIKGKLSYMSPEQVEDKPLDRRSDVFALGIVLCEALAGRRPFVATDDASLMAKILIGDPDLQELQSDPLRPVLEKALRRRADERFEDAQAFAKDLQQLCPAASSDQVAARVRELFDQELTTQSRRIADAIARSAEELPEFDEEPDEARTSNQNPSPPRADQAPAVSPERSTSPIRWVVFGLAAVLALGGAASLLRGNPPSGPTPNEDGGAVASPGAAVSVARSDELPNAEPAAMPTASAPPIAASSADPDPPSSTRPALVAKSASARPAPASASAPRALHPSPYASAKPTR